MKELRLEINLDVKDDINVADLLRRIQWACNVHGVVKVQAVHVVKGK